MAEIIETAALEAELYIGGKYSEEYEDTEEQLPLFPKEAALH